MFSSFEWKGYKYTNVPQEEIPAYADGDVKIFIVPMNKLVMPKERIQSMIDEGNIEELEKYGNFLEKMNTLTIHQQIDHFLKLFNSIKAISFKEYACFVGQKCE